MSPSPTRGARCFDLGPHASRQTIVHRFPRRVLPCTWRQSWSSTKPLEQRRLDARTRGGRSAGGRQGRARVRVGRDAAIGLGDSGRMILAVEPGRARRRPAGEGGRHHARAAEAGFLPGALRAEPFVPRAARVRRLARDLARGARLALGGEMQPPSAGLPPPLRPANCRPLRPAAPVVRDVRRARGDEDCAGENEQKQVKGSHRIAREARRTPPRSGWRFRGPRTPRRIVEGRVGTGRHTVLVADPMPLEPKK